jgi:TorA maturation chaperone TorD
VSQEDRARADWYGLIARLFYGAPDASLFAAIAGNGDACSGEGDAALPAAWKELSRAAAVADPDTVRQEYDTVFVGVGKPEVMLYGSFYLAGFLHEKPLARLREDLAALAFARRAQAAEPEDHIAALADVMRALILDEGAAPEQREAAQRAFFARHLEPWYGQLCGAVAAAPDADFYRRVAALARSFLDIEKASLRMA